MDKKTATLTLTEKLRESNNYHVIINPYYQKKLLEESIACYQIGDIIAFGSYAIRDSLKNKNSAMYEKLEPKANYLFIESFEMDKRATASSFAIIGEEEVNQLRNTFYKDVPCDVTAAMKILGVKNYELFYEKYSKDELNQLLLNEHVLYLKFQKLLADVFNNGPYPASCPKGKFETYFDTIFNTTVNDIHKKLNNLHIDTKIAGWSDEWVYKDTIENIILRFEKITFLGQHRELLSGFFDLVFTIPYEEQNIETNRAILKLSCETLDYVNILVDEYFKSKNFQGYFECLDAEKQKKVINALEFKKADNSVYNSFLWSKGFKTIGLDHLRLYKDDTKGFIEYFNAKSAEEKKAIIQDLMKSDITNEEVVNWLTKNYIDLVREVGLND